MTSALNETVARFIGASSDGRTNRWQVTCPACGNQFSPQTTRMSTQELDCPKNKCGASMAAYYNEEPAVVRLLPKDKS